MSGISALALMVTLCLHYLILWIRKRVFHPEPAQCYTVHHWRGWPSKSHPRQHSKLRSSDFKSNTVSWDALAAPWWLLSKLGPGSCPKPRHTVKFPLCIFRKWTFWVWPLSLWSLIYFFVKWGLRIPLALDTIVLTSVFFESQYQRQQRMPGNWKRFW